MSESVVAEAIDHWDSLLADDASLARKLPGLRQWLVDRELTAGGRPLCSVLRPHLIAAADFERQAQAAAHVISAVYKVRDALLADEALRDRYLGAFREAIGRLLEIETDPAGDGALMRLDSSLARTRLHFIELNADMPQGTGHNDRIADFFEQLEVFGEFERRYRADALRLEAPLLDTLLAAWAAWDGRDRPAIATLSWRDDEVRWTGLEIDTEELGRRGYDARLCDPRELDFDGGRLRHGDREIDLVHRVLLTGECLERGAEVAPLLDAVAAGAVCMVNPFRSELLGHKAIFALLTEPEHDFGFSGPERRAIREHVPWTRVLRDEATTGPGAERVELVEHAIAERERLVLKPSHDFGGHGVHLGWQEEPSQWETSVRRALEEDYIVQQRVHLHRERYPTIEAPGAAADLYVDTDPFVFDGRVGGMLTRLSPSEITNVHAHGSVVASFAIDPRG